MNDSHPSVLEAEGSCLMVIDLQERFGPVIDGFDSIAERAARLVKTFRILGLPILVTEQYPKGLGHTVPALLEACGGADPHEKTRFSSCGSDDVAGKLSSLSPRQLVVCGVETHVCVSQTAHDLLARGLQVHVAADAVGSRRPEDRDFALRRMERAGAVLTTSEAAAFELLRDARHPRFKDVQALFK